MSAYAATALSGSKALSSAGNAVSNAVTWRRGRLGFFVPSGVNVGELNMDGTSAWNSDWAWSVPLIVLTVLIHVIGLGLFNVKMVQVLTVVKDRRYFIYAFALGIGITTIWATLLHAIEACVYRQLRFERIGGAARRPAHEIRCVRLAE